MITSLTNKMDKNDEKNEEKIIQGKIINNKNNNLYFQYNNFIIDEKNEKNLKNFCINSLSSQLINYNPIFLVNIRKRKSN